MIVNWKKKSLFYYQGFQREKQSGQGGGAMDGQHRKIQQCGGWS